MALSVTFRGARVPVGPRGTYVGFGNGAFFYRVKADKGGSSTARHATAVSIHTIAPAPPDAVVRDLDARSRRVNFFRLYLWLAGALLVVSLVEPAAFVVLLVVVAIAGFFVRRWDRERRTARIFYDVDNDEIVGRLALCAVGGQALAHTARLWHLLAANATFDRKYHAGAGWLVRRAPTKCENRTPDRIEVNVDCWTIAIGALQLLFLPDQLLVGDGSRWMSVGYDHLRIHHETTPFVEDAAVPPDTQVVDTTWRFVNKSGGPDLRFNNNVRLPVVAYGKLTLLTGTALQVVMQSSNPMATERAAAALQELVRIAREPARASSAAQPAPPPTSAQQGVIPATAERDMETWANAARVEQRDQARRVHITPSPGSTRPSPSQSSREERRVPAPPPFTVAPPRASSRSASVPENRGVPAPSPPLARTPQRAISPGVSAIPRFCGSGEPVSIAGRTIASPLTYVVQASSFNNDASTIVTSLPVGDASRALPLPYWPRYSEIDSDQRARYLEWMASGRADPTVAIGYVFIFFYGLERRVLLDDADEEAARAEVTRLIALYGENRSFRAYASDFVSFTHLRHPERLLRLSWAEVVGKLGPLVADSTTALAALGAWHHINGRPLSAEHAALFVRGMESAKRGAVVNRSAHELLDLFSIRYREAFGDGLLVDAAKRVLTIEYRPASATLLGMGRAMKVVLPDVLGKASQYRKLVTLWNECVDDLRKADARRRGAKVLDAAAWSALPAELRAEYDHPEQDKWDAAIAAAPVLAGFRLATVGQLAQLVGLERSEKLTPTQLKKIASRAADVGYTMEPEPRVRSKAAEWTSETLIWRARLDVPDARLYGAVLTMLSLVMTIAMADGVFAEEEDQIVSSFLAELFVLDEGMRSRVEAMKQLMARAPSRLGSVAKTLKATRTPTELTTIAAVLVAIAAADGTIAESEEKALRSLYRSLGLPTGDLAATIARTGARLERDDVVEGRAASVGAGGIPIPSAPDAAPRLQLDRAAIEAIVADTRDVAAILAEVFEAEVEEPQSASPASVDSSEPRATRAAISELPRPSEATTALALGLDVRYHAVLEHLLTKPAWAPAEIRSIADRHRLMPAAILDTINAWSDDVLGDLLIEDVGEWKVNRELARVTE